MSVCVWGGGGSSPPGCNLLYIWLVHDQERVTIPYFTYAPAGERPQRARQLWRWMYHDKAWARSIEATADLTNGFGAPYRFGLPYQERVKQSRGLGSRIPPPPPASPNPSPTICAQVRRLKNQGQYMF